MILHRNLPSVFAYKAKINFNNLIKCQNFEWFLGAL